MNVVSLPVQLHVGAGEEGSQSVALPRASNAVKTALNPVTLLPSRLWPLLVHFPASASLSIPLLS